MSAVPRSQRLLMRVIAAVIAVLLVVLWFVRASAEAPVEPLWVRLLVSSAWVSFLVATFVVPRVRRNPQGWILWPVLAILPLLHIGVVQNEFAWRSLPGVLMVMFCGSLLLPDRRSLLVFLGVVVTGLVVGLQLVPNPEALPQYFLAVTGVTALIILLSQELRFRALETLNESQARMRRAQTLDHIGGWEYRLADNRFVLSPELRTMMAWDDALLRDETRTEEFVATDDLNTLRDAIAAMRTRPEPFTLELQARDGDGGPRHLRIAGEAVFDSRGTAVAVIGIAHDVTEDVRNADHLRRARDDARQAAEARARFLANMSHEIRTPLNGVIGMTHVLGGEALTNNQQECVETIRASGETLMTIINDILDISKIDAGKIELEHHTFALEPAVADSLALFAPRATAKGLELSCLVEPEVPREVCGDVTRLGQVLANLISNAIKFTDRGDVHVHVGGRWQDDTVFELDVCVRDTGIGIAPEHVSHLFDAFTQQDASTTRRYGGTGLGLSISQHLVELMGGRIEVHGEPGVGSEFRFVLPLQARRDQAPVPDGLNGMRVLAVDDNATNRTVLARILERLGAQPHVVGTPEQCLAAAADGNWDRYVVDQLMPGMDGSVLARQLRAQTRGNPVPIVLLSSLGADVADRQLFDAILTKPVRTDVLRSTLASTPTAGRPNANVRPVRQHNAAILLVEDNPVNQKVALRTLERLGLAPDVANNGVEAVDAVQRSPRDVVFMDVQMPLMDGLEATRQIRAMQTRADTWIIAMTANAMPGDRERCLAAGMNDYLAKPVTVAGVEAALTRWQEAHPGRVDPGYVRSADGISVS